MVALTKQRFDQPDDVRRYPRATLDVVRMNGSIWWRMTLEPGWRDSESMGPVEGTESCPGEHLFMLMLAGRLAVGAFRSNEEGPAMRHNMLLSISGSILIVSAIACAPPGEPQWGQDTTAALDRHDQAVRAFNAQDTDAVADLYAAEAVLHDPQQPEPIRGRDAIREGYAQMFRTFPDIEVTILNRHVEGNLMMYELRLTGTNQGPIPTPDGEIPATGERIDLPAAVFAGLDGDGRFRDTRRYYDVAAMMRQLGLEDGE